MYEVAVGVEAETGGGQGGTQGLIVGHLFVIGIEIETEEQNGTPGNTWCAPFGSRIEHFSPPKKDIARVHVVVT